MTPKNFIRRSALGVLSLICVYVLACSYLWARQERFIFMPRREIKKTPAIYQLPYKDVYLPVEAPGGRKELIHGWWIPAQRPTGNVLLYLHGSALNIGANVDHARRFHNLGFDVFIVSYRGYGLSDGEFPSEAQVYADAEAAWKYLVGQRELEQGQIFIYGHSIGGGHNNSASVGGEDYLRSIREFEQFVRQKL